MWCLWTWFNGGSGSVRLDSVIFEVFSNLSDSTVEDVFIAEVEQLVPFYIYRSFDTLNRHLSHCLSFQNIRHKVSLLEDFQRGYSDL